MDIIKKDTGKVNSVEQVPTLLANDQRLSLQEMRPMPSIIK